MTRPIPSDRKEKTCSNCKKIKSIHEFGKNKSRKDGRSQFCRVCISIVDKRYREKQRPARAAYARSRRREDVAFRLTGNLRRRLHYSLTSKRKARKTLDFLGCSVSDLMEHLESMFKEGMAWDNYGTYWEVDHIKPCVSFDLSIKEEQEKCFHFSNLQPLNKRENRVKNSWYNGVWYRG